ncbi:hypothetical protein SDC9_187016 [bioreactor metagenome]|uniref:Uncharacterized protein n=1 Tax=bioreactor metagenome TaxID=1076179 RepID=A0A645HKE3_9ZZZZ
MRALDAGRVEESGIVADQDAAREGQSGQRLQAAGNQCAGAVGDTLAALEEAADFRMRLEALELFIG